MVADKTNFLYKNIKVININTIYIKKIKIIHRI